MIRVVKDLSPDQKAAVERLVGRPVSERETVSLQVFETPAITDARRAEILAALERYHAEIDANRTRVPARDAEDAINEAIRSSRPGYRPRL